MERNLRVWDDDDDDDSREASSKVDGGGVDHVTDGFSTSGSGALRNGEGGEGGEANARSRVFWITTCRRRRA